MKKKIKNFLWLFPFISFLCGYFVLAHFFQIDDIETPNLVGKTLQDAFTILSEHKLNPRLLAHQEDADLPDGIILSQTPRPQQKIKQHQSLFLIVSKQPPKLRAPHCINKDINAINQELAQQNIRNKTYYLISNHPKGLCLAQFPTQDKILETNNIITYVSAGNTKSVVWPNFKNKSLEEVIEFLTPYNINPKITHYPLPEQGHTCDNCTIIDQRPLAGSIISFDTETPTNVQLQVSPESPENA